MSLLRKVLGSMWTKFVGFGAFLGFLVDFPVAKDPLESAVGAVHPIGAALVPWVGWVGTLLFGGLFAKAGYEWVVDRLNKGPARRTFRSKRRQIVLCKELLLGLVPGRRRWNETPEEYQAALVEAAAELESLAYVLDELGIPMPNAKNGKIDPPVWIDFLSRLEVYARRSDLESATRIMEIR